MIVSQVRGAAGARGYRRADITLRRGCATPTKTHCISEQMRFARKVARSSFDLVCREVKPGAYVRHVAPDPPDNCRLCWGGQLLCSISLTLPSVRSLPPPHLLGQENSNQGFGNPMGGRGKAGPPRNNPPNGSTYCPFNVFRTGVRPLKHRMKHSHARCPGKWTRSALAPYGSARPGRASSSAERKSCILTCPQCMVHIPNHSRHTTRILAQHARTLSPR